MHLSVPVVGRGEFVVSVGAKCPHCGHEFIRPNGLAGKLEKCPQCRHVFRLPAASPEVESRLSHAISSRKDGIPDAAHERPSDQEKTIQNAVPVGEPSSAADDTADSCEAEHQGVNEVTQRDPKFGNQRKRRLARYVGWSAAVATILLIGGILFLTTYHGEPLPDQVQPEDQKTPVRETTVEGVDQSAKERAADVSVQRVP
jgi:hypothetical protein